MNRTAFRPMTIRPGDTCETQREMAAHNSVLDTLRKGEKKVYCSPCDCPELYGPPQPSAPPAAGKEDLEEAPARETS